MIPHPVSDLPGWMSSKHQTLMKPVMNSLDEKVMEKIEKTYRPVIIPIPTGLKGTRSSYLEGLLRRAIGYNIVVG
jgi:vacuolar-type H+-ATPase subunit F/Vma7